MDPSTIVADGGDVTAWTDKSGLGNSVTAYFAPPFPSLVPAAANGANAIDFEVVDAGRLSGGTPFMITDPGVLMLPGFDFGQGDFTTEVVVGLHSQAAIENYVWSLFNANSNGVGYSTVSILSVDGGLGVQTYSDLSQAQALVVTNVNPVDARFHLIGVRRHSGLLEARVDGNSRGALADVGVLAPSADVAIGGWPGEYVEVRVMAGTLSDADLGDMETQMMSIYGIFP